MGLSFEEVKRIKKQFQELHVFIEPLSEYTNGCGISKIGIQDTSADSNTYNDFCIIVMLRKPLPENLSVPAEYQNVKVFTKVVGEIRAL